MKKYEKIISENNENTPNKKYQKNIHITNFYSSSQDFQIMEKINQISSF